MNRRTVIRLGLGKLLLVSVFSVFLVSPVLAQPRVQDAWARPTVAGQTVGAAYFRLELGPAGDRLLSVSTIQAKTVEIHSMNMEGDVMRMRPVESVELPAGQSVEFKPGGLHLMLIGLKTPLKVGNRVPVSLKFERAGALQIDVPVLSGAPGASAGASGHGEHRH